MTFDYPPLFHTATDHTFSGTVGETVKMMCIKAALNCSIEVLPFKRAYQKLEKNQADAIITIKVDKFLECCTPTQWETPWRAGFFTSNEVTPSP